MKVFTLLALSGLAGAAPAVHAQRFEFSPATTEDAALDQALPALARQAIAVYKDSNQGAYLGNLFRLQMVAGDYSAASATLRTLRDLNAMQPGNASAALAADEIAVTAAQRHVATGMSLDDSTRAAFRELFGKLDGKAANDAIEWLWGPVGRFRGNANRIAMASKANGAIDLADALELIRNYQLYVEYRDLIPLTDALIREDDARRYLIGDQVPVRIADGATLCVLVVRPRGAPERLPTALNFTIYAGQNAMSKARLAVTHGYAAVVANARGKACSPDAISPWTTESRDAYGLIDWISKQVWSDGRVGMYGGSYEGFAQWAAVKHLHPALKTIVPWSAVHPGRVLPMSNNVFQNANYQWPFYVGNARMLDDQVNADWQRFDSLTSRWYESGKSYREIDTLDSQPNKLLQEQLKHPAFDDYWRSMTPSGREFARVKIPVLQITGYFDPAQISALDYLREHYEHDAKAEHYLVIGPYAHFGAWASQKPSIVNGYTIDAAAQFDTPELTFQWFDYVFKGGRKPNILQDRINFEVMGANEWRHARSIAAMSDDSLKFYLSDALNEGHHLLDDRKPRTSGALKQTVDFADRTPQATSNLYPDGVLVKQLELKNGLTFISEPLATTTSINGVIGGTLRAVTNKRDMDLALAVYQKTPEGEYFNLGYSVWRASYARDDKTRRLLAPGMAAPIQIRGMSLVSRVLRPGSRLVVQLTVNKNRFAQVNHGTGKDVSDESIADAKAPLEVSWLSDSRIVVPIRRETSLRGP